MPKRDRRTDVSRFWPRLRREAHELYREVSILRGRARQLEKELAREKNTADRLRQREAALNATLEETRGQLRRMERSKGWRLIMAVRGVVRRRKRGVVDAESEPAGSPEEPAAAEGSPGSEPTFAQRRAAEAARRGQVAVELNHWIEAARKANGSTVVVIAGDRTAGETTRFIETARSAGVPVIVLEADPAGGVGGLPSGIVPTLVPHLLSMDAAGKERLFVCTTPGHSGIRWVVPAQQWGWWTAALLSGPISPAAIYLASHADVAVVPDEKAARAMEEATGVRPVVNAEPSAHDLLELAGAGWDALPRAVLGD